MNINKIKNKSYEELTIADDFMFYKIMSDSKLCKELLETILNIKISKIVYHETQAYMKDSYDGKGIRLDIYAADEENTVYDVEMQATFKNDLPKRSRYYQSCIDMDLLDKGVNYKRLNKSIVIFICTYDLFNKGLPKYTFNTRCDEDKELVLGDEVTKVFVNTTASVEGIEPKLASLLEYISTGKATDEYTKNLDKAVVSSRKHKSWRNEYMKYLADVTDWIDEGKEIGYEQGKEEGIKEGIEQGMEKGIDLGKINSLIELYKEGIITLDVALTKIEMNKEQFLKLCEEYRK